MRETDIKDSEIPGADPAAVLLQYEPLINKIATRYKTILDRSGAVDLEDLYQAGRLAILQAQRQYNPAAGASFLTFIYNPVRWTIQRAVGIDANTGALPVQLLSLDETITGEDGSETTRLELLPDPDAVPMDEPIIEAETRKETAAEVRAALDRMKSDKQRDIIERVYLEGKSRQQVAEETGAKIGAVRALDRDGKSTLRRDVRLRIYACHIMPTFNVGVNHFRTSWTSATEAAVIWRDEHLPDYITRKEAAAEDLDTGRHWTPAQTLAYMRRLKERHQEEN